MTVNEDAFSELIGKAIVLDVVSRYVYIGTLVDRDERFAILEDADVHDLHDTMTTRELYVVESKRHGVRSNRKRVLVRIDEIVSASALDDVLD